jgi:hypothetical protein
MDLVQIPDDVYNDPHYFWENVVAGGGKVRRIYMNKDFKPKLLAALQTLKNNGALCVLQTFDGLFNIRSIRGSYAVSGHSYGIAIDVNAKDGPLGKAPKMEQAIVDAFVGAGLTWGGTWKRPDGMHFSLGF